MNEHHQDHHEDGDHAHGHSGSRSALTLISLAHGINHAQSALKPLVYPLVLRDLGFGYAELGIMLGVASAVGGSLQFVAGALGRYVKRPLLLGFGNASVGICFFLIALAQSFPQFFLWTVVSRVGGAAQHPVGSALLSHHFRRKHLGTALAAHFTAGTSVPRLFPCLRQFSSLFGAGASRRSYSPFQRSSSVSRCALSCTILERPTRRKVTPRTPSGKTASLPLAM